MSSEYFLTDLNVFEFMPEIGMYHFIFRFVEEVSLQLSQDKTSEGMSLMENGGKATLCSFRFTRHVH